MQKQLEQTTVPTTQISPEMSDETRQGILTMLTANVNEAFNFELAETKPKVVTPFEL